MNASRHVRISTSYDTVIARLHIDHTDLSDPKSAQREVTRLAFQAVDRKFGTRAWYNETVLDQSASHWVTTFTPIPRDELPGIPRFGR